MIKINLLGNETAVNYTARYILAGYAASVIIGVVVCIALQRSIAVEVRELNEKVTASQTTLDALKQKTKTVDELDKKRKLLNSKLALIARLKKNKIGPVRMLDDLNLAVPGRVWLRDMAEKDGELTIKGRALGDQDVAQFAQNLAASEYFREVNLQEVRQMLYSRKTGKVTAMADVKSNTEFGSDGRVAKETAIKRGGRKSERGDGGGGRRWSVREGEAGSDRNRFIDKNYIKIREFRLTAKVNYHGRLKKIEEESRPSPMGEVS